MSIAHLIQGICVILLFIESIRIRENKPFGPARLLYVVILTAIVLGGLNYLIFHN